METQKNTPHQNKPVIEVLNLELFGYWRFSTSVTDCQICKEIFESPCLKCTKTHVNGELVCDVSKGKCGHSFHRHCIDSWITKNNVCPICSTPYANEIKNLNNEDDWKKIYTRDNKISGPQKVQTTKKITGDPTPMQVVD
jgi:hypothetical protein